MDNAINSRPDRPTNQDPVQMRRWRVAAGLSATAAAMRLGISKGYLSKLENGIKGASPEMLTRIAEAYGCEVIDLMRDPPQRRDIAV
jgi:transcriptional regulator with XRE-family HTH domain